jgi:hypothetical protein
MQSACERATSQEVAHLGLLVYQLEQRIRYLIAELLRHVKPGRGGRRDVGEAQPAAELGHGAIRCKRGTLLHGEPAQHGVLLENHRDSFREIGRNAPTLQILRPVV